MLIQIHGLPLKTKYHDVKLLIRSECTISEYQLDALAAEGDRCKKVLVTVGNEAEGLCLIKCLNGFHVSSEHCLRVEPVDMVKANTMDAPHQSTYEQRPGSNYTNQPRNVYPNQMAGDYNRGPQSYAPSGSHMSQRPVEPTGVRPEVWSSGSIPGDQWSHNQAVNVQGPPSSGFPGTPIYPQHPSMPQRAENNSYTDNRSQQSSNYGYTPKNNIPVAGHQQYRSHDPRSVEAADAMLNHIPSPSGRYPQSFQQEKPITIMKDNFQGPTMHQIGSGNPGSYQGPTVHGGNSSWNQGQQPKHQPYLKSNPAQYEKFYDDDRRHSQSGKRSEVVKPQDGARMAYKDYEKGRQFSPSRRIASDHAMPASMNVKKRVSPPVGHGPPTREPMSRRLASPERKIPSMGMAPRRPSPNRNMSPGHPGSPSVRWVPAARPATSPSARRISPSGRRASPSRRVSPSARRYSPGHRISPSGRRGSPSGRRGSPMARRMSPGRGAMSPGGRVSPSGRRISPSGRRPPPPERRASPGRRTSPHKHISPPGRRMSPTGRHMVDRRVSPRRMAMQKHNSPSRRLESPPPGQDPRQAPRYSPRRHHDKMADPKMEMDPSKNKLVRPAYESQASSQAMYSGGYRPNPKENVPYAMSSARQPDQRGSPWQQERDKNAYVALKKQDDDRRGVMEKHHAPRQSRSPLHRDRSPIKDRYRTNSPVSHSPRRSWALEKRPYGRSPEIREAPPPPIWPGKNPRDDDPYKNKYNRPDDPPKHPSVWDRPPITQEDKKRLEDVRRSGEDKRMGGGPSQRDMGPAGQYGQSQREPKFSSREYIDSRKEDYQRQRDMARRPSPGDSRKDVYPRQPGVPRRLSPDRREFREAPHSGHREERRHDEYRRQPSPRHQESKKTEFHKDFDKDFEDIYKRTQEFKKKAEQMRRSGDRRRDTHSEERHRDTSKEQYDRRRERSPQQRGEMERLPIESERRRYEEQKHKEREPEWRLPNMTRKNTFLPQEAKIKRDKAADEILEKILTKHKQFADLRGEQKRRATEEMKLALNRLFMDMFGQEDVSFIEIVIKYQTKISNKAEEAMVHDVLQCLTSQFRSSKRPGPEPDVPAKMARYSPEDSMKEDDADDRDSDYVPDWTLNVIEPASEDVPAKPSELVKAVLPPPQLVIPQLAAPPSATSNLTNFASTVTPQQFIAPQLGIPQTMFPLVSQMSAMMQYVPTFIPNQYRDDRAARETDPNNKLFLFRDDFQPITKMESELLKNFVVSKIIQVTETSAGWAPDLTLKGLNTVQRYELCANDEMSKNWLINLDFSGFRHFTVLVYTAEELWYERAAVWLPGHSRYLSIEPLVKLKLQNQHLQDINIGKWKFVKKVSNMNGTRLYVDMPPSSVKALEKHKMMLNYELQKVNVILKAVAVDKNTFDAGLKDKSLIDSTALATAVNNTPIPSLSYEPGLVQLTIKGNKTLSINEARELKEIIIFHLYEHLMSGGKNKTLFLKYGFCPPNCFAILPENDESRKWLLSTQFGELNDRPIVVVGGDDSLMKYIDMYMYLPVDLTINPALAVEKLRKSNQGVKGINFHLWKPRTRTSNLNRKNPVLDIAMDIESIETLQKLNFKLDYIDSNNEVKTVFVCSNYSAAKLKILVNKYKAESKDSYDVANMDLDSNGDEDDVICLN